MEQEQQKQKQRAAAIQLTLPQVMQEDVVREPIKCWRTEQFEVCAIVAALDKFNEKLESKRKNGQPKFSKEEQATARRDWLQHKMKARVSDDITGEHYYHGKLALHEKIFEKRLNE